MQASINERRKLLYGHTIGHALECYDDSLRRHGECVAIGMNYEAALGVQLGRLPERVWKTQLEALQRFDLPTRVPEEVDMEVLGKRICSSKMAGNDSVCFVLPSDLGISDLERQLAVPAADICDLLVSTQRWLNDRLPLPQTH